MTTVDTCMLRTCMQTYRFVTAVQNTPMMQKQRRRLNIIIQIQKYERLWNNFDVSKSSRIILIYMPPKIIVKMFIGTTARKS